MTRFEIPPRRRREIVQRALGMMHGGEIFIPKIASMRITDLATAICADCEQETVGIRPGEKLHELLITHDDAGTRLNSFAFLWFNPPSICGARASLANSGGEEGRPVQPDFEYASNSTVLWLDSEQLKAAIE